MTKPIDDDIDETPLRSCVLCAHPHAERHHVIPREWGGPDREDNVLLLCPNHHRGIHYMMDWYLDQVRRIKAKADDPGRLVAYMADRPLQILWAALVKPLVIEKLKAEGRWHPYIKGPFLPDTMPSHDCNWDRFFGLIDRHNGTA